MPEFFEALRTDDNDWTVSLFPNETSQTSSHFLLSEVLCYNFQTSTITKQLQPFGRLLDFFIAILRRQQLWVGFQISFTLHSVLVTLMLTLQVLILIGMNDEKFAVIEFDFSVQKKRFSRIK